MPPWTPVGSRPQPQFPRSRRPEAPGHSRPSDLDAPLGVFQGRYGRYPGRRYHESVRLDGGTSFTRAEPTHGSSPSWLGNLIANKKSWAVNGRFVYTGGQRNFVQDETATGIDRIGNNVNRQCHCLRRRAPAVFHRRSLLQHFSRRPLHPGQLHVVLQPAHRRQFELSAIQSRHQHGQRGELPVPGDPHHRQCHGPALQGGEMVQRLCRLSLFGAADSDHRRLRAARVRSRSRPPPSRTITRTWARSASA